MNNSTLYKRTQLPANALWIGIDPHKKQHTICITDATQTVLSKFKIATSRNGFEELLRRSEQQRQTVGASQIVFGIEPGGHYWRTLAAFLQARTYEVRFINPFTLKRQRDGDDLTHRKNDFRDATKAAELLAQGKYTWTAEPSGTYAELRRCHTTYQQVCAEYARLKQQLTTALDQLFPEFQSVFKQVDGQTALTVLASEARPAVLAAQEVTACIAQLRTVHRQHGRHGFQQKKVRALYGLATQSVGLTDGATALNSQVQSLVAHLSFVQTQVSEAEIALRQCFATCSESRWLNSIFGLGVINAAGVLAEIGDIQRFSGVKQLTKLAGIQPIEDSSAERRAGHTPMSKKGRSGLRKIAFRAVIGLLRHNQVFQQYVARLHTRTTHPLTKRQAIGAAMNKLLRVVYTLLKRQEVFDPQKG
jgi:transposase